MDNGIQWWMLNKEILTGYSAMTLPADYRVYSLDAEAVARFFSLADNNKSTLFTVPLGNLPNCVQYDVSRAEILSDSLKKKYPQLVSLKGRGTKGDDIRLDYNGSVLQAQVISNGEMYYITPLNHDGKTYYIVYKRSDSKQLKQEFEKP